MAEATNRTCKDCGTRYEPWQNWDHPGSAGCRCHTCYCAYTRERQRRSGGHQPRESAAGRGKPSGRAWQNFIHAIYAEETLCGFCGGYVDQTLPHNDRMSRTVDHIIPISLGGAVWERSNIRLAHRSCNSKAGNALARQRVEHQLALARAALWIQTRLDGSHEAAAPQGNLRPTLTGAGSDSGG